MRWEINKTSGMKIVLHLILILFNLPCNAQSDENIIKAAYIERITRFVEWPQLKSSKDTVTFKIGVYRDNELYNILKIALKDKTIKNRKVTVIELANYENIVSCNLCYLSLISNNEIDRLMSIANQSGVLILSFGQDYGIKGIHINFYIEENKLKFEINRKSVSAGNFKISSLLMNNSKII